MKKIVQLAILMLFAQMLLQAQTSQDAAVAITANVALDPSKITLNWTVNAPSTVALRRRLKGGAGNFWTTLINQTNSTTATYEDTSVEMGKTYEYSLRVTANNVTAYGFAHVAVLEPVVHQRGKILVFIDEATADAVGNELKIFKDAMRGDGWQPMPFKTGPTTTVEWVKSQIVEAYADDPTNVKAVLIIGPVPVPYSGNLTWDGHPEHAGAWPADTYYSDINGLWTDNAVNNPNMARAANNNVPGDGKFDQTNMPSAAELQVGRIDFSHLSTTTFGASPIELTKRYLLKNARWRTKQYTVPEKALVDDNFGYFSGEAFASNGYRNAYPMVGANNVVAGDFFTDEGAYLFGYGCGPGSYTSAGGVGSSTNFATDSINMVFTSIFGSYHGDWDYETDPLMPAALASKGGILNCIWAGRPHWFLQALASGETIGFCTKETMNAQYNNQYGYTFGMGGAHVALMGDPTVRARMVAPPTNLTSQILCNGVRLNWTASVDTGLLGYHIYRSPGLDGPYDLASPALINGSTWTDNAAISDTMYYQVRAIRLESTPGGGIYHNNSIGPIVRTIYQAQPSPTVQISNPGTSLTCSAPTLVLTALAANPNPGGQFTYQWFGPNNAALGTASTQNVDQAGTYTVVATSDLNCTASATTTVLANNAPPSVALPPALLTCSQTIPVLQLPSTPTNFTYTYGGTVYLPGQTITGIVLGNNAVLVTNTATGCTATEVFEVQIDTEVPGLSVNAPITTLTCTQPTVSLTAISPTPNVTYKWTNQSGTVLSTDPLLVVSAPGTYTVVVTNAAGCTNTSVAVVTANVEQPIVTFPPVLLTCVNLGNSLTFPCTPAFYTYTYNGQVFQPCSAMPVTGPGVYPFGVTNTQNGCTSLAILTVGQNVDVPLVGITAPTTTLSCTVTEIPLSVTTNLPASLVSYAWTGPVIDVLNPIVTQAGAYCVVLTNAENGCTSTDCITIEKAADALDGTANITPSTTPTTNDGAIVFVPETPSIYAFLWSNGATTASISGLSPGIYTITVTDQLNQCSAVFSYEVGFVSNTPELQGMTHLSIAPNPANDRVVVNLELRAATALEALLYGTNGSLVGQQWAANGTSHRFDFEVGHLPPGIYWLALRGETGQVVRKIVVMP
jgi:hypothetical protein